MPAQKRSGVATRKKTVTKYPTSKRITKHGAYTFENPGPFGQAGQAIGGIVGSSLGGRALGSALATGGRYLGHKVGKLFGSGAYGMQGNILAPGEQLPKFANDNNDDSICITHREYLGDLITSSTIGAFKIDTFPLNPACVQTYPWLSNIAQPNFQQYKFEGCIFSFQSFSADALNSTNTALGSVFAAINYDFSDADFTTRNQIENSDWSMSCKPSDSMLIPVECAPRQTGMGGLLYIINDTNVPANADPKTYYLGKLTIGTTGFQAANINIGSLYVTYKVRLYKKIMTPPLSNALMASFCRSGSSAGANVLGTATYVNSPDNSCDSIGVTFPTNNTFRFNSKKLIQGMRFAVNINWIGVSTASVLGPDPTLSTQSGFTTVPGSLNNYQSPYMSTPNAAVTSTVVSLMMIIEVKNDTINNDWEFSPTGFVPPASCLTNIHIWQITSNAYSRIGYYDGN